MGATLPTLTRYLTQGGRGIAGAFQRLYTANTIGAIVGTALAGFVLIELLGLTGALVVGAVCSGTAGLVALALDRRSGPPRGRRVPAPARGAASAAGRPRGVAGAHRCARPHASPRADARLRVRPDVAGLPGGLEPPPRRRDGQLHLRVHDHPRAVPGRHRDRCGARWAGSGRASGPTTLLIAVAQLADRGLRDHRRGRPGVPAVPVQRRVSPTS